MIHPFSKKGGLHDYANREWNGLLSSYYYPRWKAFFTNDNVEQSWFDDYEWLFVTGTVGDISRYLPEGAPYAYGSFSAGEQNCEYFAVELLYKKYFGDYIPFLYQ